MTRYIFTNVFLYQKGDGDEMGQGKKWWGHVHRVPSITEACAVHLTLYLYGWHGNTNKKKRLKRRIHDGEKRYYYHMRGERLEHEI